jgi:hypothetical protein
MPTMSKSVVGQNSPSNRVAAETCLCAEWIGAVLWRRRLIPDRCKAFGGRAF